VSTETTEFERDCTEVLVAALRADDGVALALVRGMSRGQRESLALAAQAVAQMAGMAEERVNRR
jgi:hypothetical protein